MFGRILRRCNDSGIFFIRYPDDVRLSPHVRRKIGFNRFVVYLMTSVAQTALKMDCWSIVQPMGCSANTVNYVAPSRKGFPSVGRVTRVLERVSFFSDISILTRFHALVTATTNACFGTSSIDGFLGRV